MKLSAKKQLPAHLAAYFGYCVNGGHYEEAMELLPALRSYGPAIMLHTITKHPSKGDAVLKDWQLPKNINEKQFRRTAFFELKRKAALKKAQQNNE